MTNQIIIIKEFIESNKTARGGWNRKQIEAIGLTWPPTKGWKRSVIGNCISIVNAQIFASFTEKANKPVKNPLTKANEILTIENDCLKSQVEYFRDQFIEHEDEIERLTQELLATNALINQGQ